jgi:hypothetical protein
MDPGSGPSLCPGPMREGVYYVHHEPANLYIRHTIPDGWAPPHLEHTGPIGAGLSSFYDVG